MWRFGILLCLLIVPFSEGKDKKEVCTLLMMCDKVDEVKSEVASVREEQQTQKMISENQTLILENQADILRQQTQILELQTQILQGLTLSGTNSYPSSCADVSKETKLLIRVPKHSEDPFEVACDQRSRGGGWTIILRRNDGSEDFYRGWEDYKRGFGQLADEFFLGLDKIHAMTNDQIQELLVLLEDYDGVRAYELYDDFKVGPESNNYTLGSLGFASGDAGDSLARQLGMMFSTKDRNNDIRTDDEECAKRFTGAWWYEKCHDSNLCGKYGDNDFGKGINWYTFRGHNYSLKRAVMMIRPKTSALN
ncbi:ryncolin-4-like [Drosophila kikkawai]|uniref:Ryncolin-4-like n=1 Tax=Drosophila kikkawai TaxID=30033 RepID=A0A6P4JC24_DROKI|nr:ryncolin-4-like [Drosophila kikkawai]